MDKEWIEIVKEKLYLPTYEVQDEHDELWWTMPKELLENVLEDMAEEIAAQHGAEIAQLKGQVAVMSGALGKIKERLVYFQYRAETLEEMLDIAQQALQDAPTVLHTFRAKHSHNLDDDPVLRVLHGDGGMHVVQVYEAAYEGEDVDVLILPREQGDKSKEE